LGRELVKNISLNCWRIAAEGNAPSLENDINVFY
jgi:hypothetical protein